MEAEPNTRCRSCSPVDTRNDVVDISNNSIEGDPSNDETRKSNQAKSKPDNARLHKYVLTLRFGPASWDKTEVLEYIKKNTFTNHEIVDSIQDITKEKSGAEHQWLVTFTNQHICKEASTHLKRSEERFDGKKIWIDTYITANPQRKKRGARDRSRSPLGKQNEDQLHKLVTVEDVNGDKHKVTKLFLEKVRDICMTNVPVTWKKNKLLQYIKNNTNDLIIESIKYIHMDRGDDGSYNGISIVRFSRPERCKEAKELLTVAYNDPDNEEAKIKVDYDYKKSVIWIGDKPDYFKMNALKKIKPIRTITGQQVVKKTPTFVPKHYYPNPNQVPVGCVFRNDMIPVGQDDPDNTYGLSVDFLNCLGIRPPIGTKIFVDNLDSKYDDEAKIRHLFGHAGMVLSVAVICRVFDVLKLKVEYDHPVEAVQAISMFNNQEVYGKILKVEMDVSYNAKKRFLPDGLKAFGRGLSPNGLPLRGVRSTVEIQAMKNKIMEEVARMVRENNQNDNQSVFSENQISHADSGFNQPQNQMTALAANLANSMQNNPLLALGTLLNPQAMQVMQLLSQQNVGNLGAGLNVAQGQASSQSTPNVTSGWNTTPDVAQNMQSEYNLNTQSGPNMQSGHNMQGAANIQGGPFFQGAQNMQSGTNMQGGAYQGAQNMQSGTNMQVAPFQGGQNMQNGANMQGGPNMQGGLNMQGGGFQGGPNMQGGGFQGGSNMQSGPSNMSGPGQNQHSGRHSSNYANHNMDLSDRRSENDARCTVLFNYLPPSVTLTALQAKMKEIGDIKSSELIGPGRAVVVFYSRRDAESCIKLLDRTKVDGQMIDVRSL